MVTGINNNNERGDKATALPCNFRTKTHFISCLVKSTKFFFLNYFN